MYVIVDFICINQVEMWDTQKKLNKMKNYCLQRFSMPLPPAYPLHFFLYFAEIHYPWFCIPSLITSALPYIGRFFVIFFELAHIFSLLLHVGYWPDCKASPVYELAKTVCLSHTRIQRGGGGDRGSGNNLPPPKFVRGGVLCGCLVGRRGGPNVVFILLLNFFLSRFARQYYRKGWCLKNSNHFQVPSPFSQIVIHAISGLHFHVYFCLKLHDFTPFKPKFSGGGPPDPPKVCQK